MKNKKWTNKKSVRTLVVILFLFGITCLLGCGTARGILKGIEYTGAGLLQDFNGAINGIDEADREVLKHGSGCQLRKGL